MEGLDRLLVLASQRGAKVEIDFGYQRDVGVTFTQGRRNTPEGDEPDRMAYVATDLSAAVKGLRRDLLDAGF